MNAPASAPANAIIDHPDFSYPGRRPACARMRDAVLLAGLKQPR